MLFFIDESIVLGSNRIIRAVFLCANPAINHIINVLEQLLEVMRKTDTCLVIS